MKKIYLDYNATTPVDPEVAEAMKPYLERFFGNPSSIHYAGIKNKLAVENARKQVSDILNCKPSEIIFTSGGTESNNFAIKGIAHLNKNRGKHIITSGIEHPAITEVCKYLMNEGFDITYLDVDEYGMVNPKDLEKAVRKETILISIMHANNEVGTIQPIKDLASIAGKYNITFHTDAAQSVGKIITDVKSLGVDILSVAGHKLYAPKGIGALYLKEGTKIEKFMHGADHEGNRRAGTENVLEIVGLGKACEIAKRDMGKNYSVVNGMKNRLKDNIIKQINNARVNGHPENCLPNTLSISFQNINANTLLSELHQLAASAGAACHADSIDISTVLQAMNVPADYVEGTIRFSVGKMTTDNEIDVASEMIINAVKKLSGSENKEYNNNNQDIKLTRYTHGMGCACKIGPQDLDIVLKGLNKPKGKNILVGTGTMDDAAVYKIDENIAIVKSVDFFTPMVNDPYHFGQIAAANSLSDIYAMGAQPLFALNIVAFPTKRLPLEVLRKIIKGADDKANEAGISILGGHSIEDNEPKFGLVVTGKVHPEKILKNKGAKPGDCLILTKPLGVGIICTGIKRGIVSKEVEENVTNIMASLNKQAAESLLGKRINACTDITGFGLLGHLKEMLENENICAEIDFESIPVIEGTENLIAANVIPGGTFRNLSYVEKFVEWDDNISEHKKIILADAQTSGGLLISADENTAAKIMDEMHNNGVESAKIIGKVYKKKEFLIKVI